MLEKKAFLLPVVIDATPERGAAVPDKFHEVQWTRLPDGAAPPEFVARIRRLLSPEAPVTPWLPTRGAPDASPIPVTTGQPSSPAQPSSPSQPSSPGRPWSLQRTLPVAAVVVVLAALAYLFSNKPWMAKPVAPPAPPNSNATSSAAASPAAFNPPPHSIAVLPFVNMSGDASQEYFSDGLTEELLNSLSRINELQVAGRTSSFYFKGEHADLSTIAHKLNVATVLEGSVRRSAHTVRITAQLINAVTGFHLWSQTYDRDLGDVLKLQTEIANAVAAALEVRLLGDVAARMEIGGSHNRAANEAYLRAASGFWQVKSASDLEHVIAGFEEAVRLDPGFALAYAGLSIAFTAYGGSWATGPAIRDWHRRAEAPAHRAIALAPDLADGHLALAFCLEHSLDFARESEEYERALALAPGNARVLKNYGLFAVRMGHTEAGLAAARRAVALDPLNVVNYTFLIPALHAARRYDEAIAAYEHALSLAPDYASLRYLPLETYYALGDFQKVRSLCEGKLGEVSKTESQGCLALVYPKLGRHAEAETALAGLKALQGDDGAYDYAAIYAQWGDAAKATAWLETASRLRSPELVNLKTDPLLDPLRNEPRFQAIERALRFPD